MTPAKLDIRKELRTAIRWLRFLFGSASMVVTGAALLGLGIYVAGVARKQGWFRAKATYYVILKAASGISVGDPVEVLGSVAGQITKVEEMDPDDPQWNVYVEFIIRSPYYRYIWTDSRAEISAADFFGGRSFRVTKGINGKRTCLEEGNRITGMFCGGEYPRLTRQTKFWLLADEVPNISEQLTKLIDQAKPFVASLTELTNSLRQTAANSVGLTSNLNAAVKEVRSLVQDVRPVLQNTAQFTSQLTNGPGAFGDWLLPVPLQQQLGKTLVGMDSALAEMRTNVSDVVQALLPTLSELSDISSNLSAQVGSNTNVLREVSSLVSRSDDLIHGLQRHWLLRSAFKQDAPTNGPRHVLSPLRSERGR
jgi:ABC-type transporter Mla subunit MlaD